MRLPNRRLPSQRSDGHLPFRGTSADVEAGLPYRVLDLHVDTINACVGRALVAPLHHAVDGCFGSLEHGFDPPVTPVPHPTGDAEGNGLLAARLAEPHPLHAPRDQDALPRVPPKLGQTWHASQ